MENDASQDRAQDKQIAKLWTELEKLKSLIFGNGTSLGLVKKVEEQAEALKFCPFGLQIQKALEEHVKAHETKKKDWKDYTHLIVAVLIFLMVIAVFIFK